MRRSLHLLPQSVLQRVIIFDSALCVLPDFFDEKFSKDIRLWFIDRSFCTQSLYVKMMPKSTVIMLFTLLCRVREVVIKALPATTLFFTILCTNSKKYPTLQTFPSLLPINYLLTYKYEHYWEVHRCEKNVEVFFMAWPIYLSSFLK